MSSYIQKVNHFFTKTLWYIDVRNIGEFKAFLIRTARLLFASIREYGKNELNLRAMGLVYITIISLIPFLAVSFSVLKGFGVHNQLEPALLNVLKPLGDKGQQLATKIIEFVSNVDVKLLGGVGFGLLFYTVISLIKRIEDSLNHIWKVKSGRSFMRRISDYLSITLIGPVFFFIAIGLTATASSNTLIQKILSVEPLGFIFVYVSKILPLFIVFFVFTFIYKLIPNTKVNILSAMLGAFIAVILWQFINMLFKLGILISTNATAIYSSFAVIFIFLFWLYLNYIVLLIGAQLSYCHQNIKFLHITENAFKLSNRLKERLSLRIMLLISQNFYNGDNNHTLQSLIDTIGLHQDDISESLENLVKSNLLTETNDSPTIYLPARDLEKITVVDVLKSARSNLANEEFIESNYLTEPLISDVMNKIEGSIDSAVKELSFKDLVTKS
ncbi:MAG: YihY/virulence factor BrkB family protein [Candidatus Dadabacteria bacterium]|nr:YihY/virulence factor BrkB family protein [Candidatus Dadabacteria bacterium]NIS10196.1 YihY/virulence factor BrkB family protein [Candidatus Dadabacteria bacterium]NIV42631.1 YihY family inner membrane protein [Candidatus Dadabacteria bacterium]NIX16562.1 YihY family inner membrane protein [Candidatus Dadabacteria bacterium]NIY23111.1 YihY family inner membrane protein [Candidatus Dadabacteria bacterium]